MSLREQYQSEIQKRNEEVQRKETSDSYKKAIEAHFGGLINYSDLSPLYVDFVRNKYGEYNVFHIEELLREAIDLIKPEKWKTANMEKGDRAHCEFFQLVDQNGNVWMNRFFVSNDTPLSVRLKINKLKKLIKTSVKSQRYVEIVIGKYNRSFVLFSDGNAYDSHIAVVNGEFDPNWETAGMHTLWGSEDKEGRERFMLHFLKQVNDN